MIGTLWLLAPIAVVLVAGWITHRARDGGFVGLRALPDGRYAPLVAALASIAVVWYVWGSLHQVPVVHDEASYLLQAETFARGRWSMPAPPIPAFFEQYHVFVTPVFASKYPPAHAALLVPGVWLGLPGLVPLLLTGLTAALVFMLARRVANGWVAVLTLLLWFPVSENLIFRASYFSETTSSALWILGWWGLLEWMETDRDRWLSLVAACIGGMTLTRPLTGIAFALPIGVVVLRRCVRTRRWRALAMPAAIGVAALAVVPLWSARVTGTWRTTPWTAYAREYFPYDKLGFGLDSTPPARTLTPDMVRFNEQFLPVHARHTVGRLPATLFDRWRTIFADAFHGVRLPLALFALIGLLALPAVGWFAVAASVTLTFCYLLYAHPVDWDLYYLEILPLLPFVTACGLWATWRALQDPAPVARGVVQRLRQRVALVTPQAALAAAMFSAVLLLPALSDVRLMRRSQAIRRDYQLKFSNALGELPVTPAIVFVRYASWHHPWTSLIANEADLAAARVWLVYDRGAENADLLARAPGRAPYLFDEASGTFSALPRLAKSGD